MTPDHDDDPAAKLADAATAADRATLHAMIAGHAAICPQCQHTPDGNPIQAEPIRHGSASPLARGAGAPEQRSRPGHHAEPRRQPGRDGRARRGAAGEPTP